MKPIIILSSFIIILFILRLTHLAIRISDTNLYFYTGLELLRGQLLYKDVFFTNFPLVPYASAFYVLLTGGNLTWFYVTSTLEIFISSGLIFYIIQKQLKNHWLGLLAGITYLCSFIVLATSVHQSGVFLASLFSITAYYFYTQKKYYWLGIFCAFTLFTKAYFIPIIAAFFITVFIEHKKHLRVSSLKNNPLVQYIISFGIASLIILLPTILFSFQDMIKDVIGYSLTRGGGVPKVEVAWFFISHDFLLLALILVNIVYIKKRLFFGLSSILFLVFFFFYQDVYYLYLNLIVPTLCLSLPFIYLDLTKQFKIQKFMIPTVIGILLAINFFLYISSFQDQGKIENIEDLAKKVKAEKPQAIYGVNDTAEAVAYLSNTPLLNGIVDTNANIFRKKLLNAKELTQDAIDQKAMLVAHGAYFPEMGVEQPLLDEIFDVKLVKKHCTLFLRTPAHGEGYTNSISIFKCR